MSRDRNHPEEIFIILSADNNLYHFVPPQVGRFCCFSTPVFNRFSGKLRFSAVIFLPL